MEVLVNAAMSADGKLSTVRRQQVAISGPRDFARVDRLRREADAILVGVGTVLADDPSLTVEDPGENGLARVVLDSRARTPPDARVVQGAPPTVIVTTTAASQERVRALEESGATVLERGRDTVDVAATAAALADRGIDLLLIEGGGEIIFSWFAAGLVDRLSVFVGPMVIGGRDAPTLADGAGFETPDRFPSLALQDIEQLDEGVLLQWEVRDRQT